MFHGEITDWPGIDMMSAQHDGGYLQPCSQRTMTWWPGNPCLAPSKQGIHPNVPMLHHSICEGRTRVW
jgi:hypothetical protein